MVCESGNDSAVLFASLLFPEGQMGEAWVKLLERTAGSSKQLFFVIGLVLLIYLVAPGYISLTWQTTVPKTNMDAQNDGLEKVTPFKHGNFGWFLGCNRL